MSRPSPYHSQTYPFEGFRQIQDQGCRSLIFFSCLEFESFHVEQDFPHRSLSSLIASISGIPFTWILVFATLPRLAPSELPTNGSRNWPFTSGTPRNQEEHRCAGLLPPSSTLFHLLQQFHHFSSFSWSNSEQLWGENHRIQLPFLPCKSSPPLLGHSLSLNLGMSSSSFFNSSFLHGLFF